MKIIYQELNKILQIIFWLYFNFCNVIKKNKTLLKKQSLHMQATPDDGP